MIPVKRVLIVADAQKSDHIARILRAHGVTGFVVLHEVQGQRDRPLDVLTGNFHTRMIMTICPPEKVDGLVEALRPILSLCNGTCTVHDAQCVIHGPAGSSTPAQVP